MNDIPGITMSPSPSIENGRAESAVGNKSCRRIGKSFQSE